MSMDVMLGLKKVKDENGKYVGIEDYGPSLAVQSLEKETNINQIVKRMEKGQMLDNLRNDGVFEDVSEFTGLADAYIKVQESKKLFELLPADVKERFSNNPVELVEFLEDVGNRKEAEELGLVNFRPEEAGEPASIPPAAGGVTPK